MASVLLFDLGGVLIDFSFSRALAYWAPYSALPAEELRHRFRFDDAYARHERGELTAEEYFRHLAATLELDAMPEEVAAGWNAIFIAEITAVTRLVAQVRDRIPCYAFTNTNAAHMATWTAAFPDVFALFQRVFASHEIGRRKPEREAFLHVCREIGQPPAEILFFDDLAENVQGARAAGLPAVLVTAPEDVAAAIAQLPRLHGDRQDGSR